MIYIIHSLTLNDLSPIKVIYFIKQILTMLLILVPIILIAIGTIELFKIMMDPNKSKEGISKVTKKMIYAVIIFFVPLIVNFITDMVGYNLNTSNLWINANKETINELEKLEKSQIEAKKVALEKERKEKSERKKLEKERIKNEIERQKLESENNNINNSNSNNYIDSGGNTLRDQIVTFALKYEGKPYVWGGNSLEKGVDCSGFTHQVYKHFNIDTPRNTKAIASSGKSVSLGSLKKGDLVMYTKPSNIHHVALYIGNNKIIHAKGKKWGVTIDSINYGTPYKGVSFIND